MAVTACRVIVALNALWIVLSRPDLPGVMRWPAAFWRNVGWPIRVRHLLVPLPDAVERTLYVLLVVALFLAILGVVPRLSCLIAAILLYRFAPLEGIFTITTGPHFRGLTIPVLVLTVLAFAKASDKDRSPSPDYRWPLMLARVLVAWIYVSSGIAKLRDVGLSWISAEQFQRLVQSLALPEYTAPWADFFAQHERLAAVAALAGFVFDFVVLIALFWPRTARVVIPAVLLSHLFIWEVFGVYFLSAPLLLLFLPWESVDDRSSSVYGNRV
jgi:hypothetical protein